MCFILSVCTAIEGYSKHYKIEGKHKPAPVRARQTSKTGGMVLGNTAGPFNANAPDLGGCPKNGCYSIDNGKCVPNDKCYHVNCQGGGAVEFKFKEKFVWSVVFRNRQKERYNQLTKD